MSERIALDLKQFSEDNRETLTKPLDLSDLDFTILTEADCEFQYPDSNNFKGLYLLPTDEGRSAINTIKNTIVIYKILNLNVKTLVERYSITDDDRFSEILESEDIALLVVYNTNLLFNAMITLDKRHWPYILTKFSIMARFTDEV